MSKEIRNYLIIFTLSFVLVYAAFAFVALNLNPACWNIGARFMYIMAALFVFGCSCAIHSENNSK